MNIWLMICLCCVVTLLPRIVPYFMPFLSNLPKNIRKCMLLLPVAALGALIFPLALKDFGPEWYAGLVGVTVAFFVSYFKGPMILAIVIALISTSCILCI